MVKFLFLQKCFLIITDSCEHISGMECRIATASDKEAIIAAFPDIYGGRDYLAFEYDSYMKSEKYKCFVGELGGNIVSYIF